MRLNELKALFTAELDKIKLNKQPTTRYIIIAYNRVLNTLDNAALNENEVMNDKKIDALDLTPHMKDKLKKMLKQKPPAIKPAQLKKDLDKLLGIGEKKANELIELGLKNINQLHQKKWFNLLHKDTQLMLQHKPLRKIPHNDIKKIEKKLTGFTLHNSHVVITGSYRRKKPFSKDIDVLLRAEKEEHLDDYINYLKKKFNNEVYLYSKGSDRISLIIKPFKNEEVKYKVDIFRASPETYYTNLLYSTGPKEFNIKMRLKAKRAGLLLNQNGFYKNGEKINKNTDDEVKLFSIVKMEYVAPENRI